MDARQEVLSILDEVLNLRGRTARFKDETPLLGSVPELDSMAVASVITTLEERFGIVIADDEIDGSSFATVGYARGLRPQQDPGLRSWLAEFPNPSISPQQEEIASASIMSPFMRRRRGEASFTFTRLPRR